MALTEKTIVDRREILEDGHIQVRTAHIIMRDGVEISRRNSRHVVAPGADVSGEDESVQRIAAVEHTPEKTAAHQARTRP